MRFTLFFILFFVPAFVDGLIITEVQVEGEKADECYIKIHNSLDDDIDISGYNLRKKTSTGTDSSVRVFPEGSIIESRNYFIWASSRDKNFPEKVEADVFSTQYLSYNNSVALFNKERDLIDAVAWGDGDNQYFLGRPLENPEKGQVIKRLKTNGNYSIKKDNSVDFSLYPPPSSPLQIEDFYTEKEESDSKNYFFTSFFLSLVMATIILLLKKWQDTATQKM